MSEKQLQSSIFAALGKRDDVRLFRNTGGVGWVGQFVEQSGPLTVLRNARRATFGLHPGSADLIGWQSIIVTPDMVGQPVAVFLSLEIKKPGGHVAREQDNWRRVVDQYGGRAAIVDSLDAAEQLVSSVPK